MDYGAMDSRVNIRGMERGALVLVNGAPINLNGKNSVSGIPLDDVKKVEIVRGAASTLYGAEAMSGVINIITKTAGKQEMNVTVTGGDYGRKGYNVAVGTDKARVYVGKTWRGALSQTSPVRVDKKKTGKDYYNSLGKSDDLALGANVKLGDYVTLNYMRSEANNQYSQTSTAPTVEDRQKKTKTFRYNDRRNNATISFEKDALKALVYYNDRLLFGQTQDFTKFKDGGFHENDSNFRARKIGTDVQYTWKLRDEKDVLIGGVQYTKDSYRGESKENRDIDASRRTSAVYASYHHAFNEQWSTILGMRYQHIDDPVKDQNVWTPQWQLLYKANPTTSFYANVGKAFTMPNLSDTMKKVDKQYQKVSGKNLKPEEGWNYELGMKKIMGKDSFKVDVFHMDLKNLFDWAEDANKKKTIRVNGGAFRNTGIEMEYEHQLNEKWKWQFGTIYSNPQQQAIGSSNWSLAYPRWQVTSGAHYNHGKWQAGTAVNWLTGRLTSKDGVKNPDLIRWNAYAVYRVNDDSKVRVNVENILNRRNMITNGNYEYWDYPRHVEISYSYKF